MDDMHAVPTFFEAGDMALLTVPFGPTPAGFISEGRVCASIDVGPIRGTEPCRDWLSG